MKNEFNQGVSLRIFASDHVRKDGTSTIFLRVTIDRSKREFNLNVNWPRDKFDAVKQVVMSRHAKDSEVGSVA